MKKSQFEKLDFTVIKPGDKLIVQPPNPLTSEQGRNLGIMLRAFMDKPTENILIIPEGFRLFLLKKGTVVELERSGQVERNE